MLFLKWKKLYRFGMLFLTGFVIWAIIGANPFWQLEMKAVGKDSMLLSLANNQSSEITESNLSQQATKLYNLGQYDRAIALWVQALAQTQDKQDTAHINSNLGSAYRQIGSLDKAIDHWEQAVKIYSSLGDSNSQRQLTLILIDEAQAYNALGQSRIALPLLQSVIKITRQSQDRSTEAMALGVLGNVYWATGDYDRAIDTLQNCLKLATAQNNSAYITTALNDLGNALNNRSQRYLLQAHVANNEGDDKEEISLTQLAQQDADRALDAYQRSIKVAATLGGIPYATASINLARALLKTPDSPPDAIASYLSQAQEILEKLPDSRTKANALINLAEIPTPENSQFKIANLERAIAIAKSIGDLRTESFALGTMGHVYELSSQWVEAMELTRQAITTSQQVNASDSLYRWQWQAGRIHSANGEKEAAIASYKQAIVTLESIRSDIVAANKDLQFDVRDSVEPVYRELIALLLDEENQDNKTVSSALQVLDLLKLTELQNFFGDRCVKIAQAKTSPTADLAAANAVLIESIILEKKSYMTLMKPDGSLKSYPVALTAQQLHNEIDRLRFTLENIATDEYLAQSQKIYDLLIRPMEADLAKAKPSSLIFINDGVLRNVPMAALHDGKKFLVEKYSIASTLGFNLNSIQRVNHKFRALTFGLTVERPPFAPLPNVGAETQGVQDILGGTRLIDKDFTISNLQQQIQKESYSIVHLATHAKFGADPSRTFLQAYDGRISLSEFEAILRQSKAPIELLTLSACQTAAGDNRSTLGIAGVAARSGVKSVLASLWFVNDEDTVPLIKDFYQQLRQPGITKIEALRLAQLKVIADPNGHPAIWSPFILIGNWL